MPIPPERAPMAPDRRRAARYPFKAEMEVEWGSAILRGQVLDISVKGLFIEVSDPLWVGASFSARLLLEEPVHLDCVVRRVEPGKGMGVLFEVSDQESRARLTALLEKLVQK
ncbi:MAG: PilZ domain-containing protein [Acidobacteria bacterium]|nr:PilZ domain-containing protein [Acidobacteriota bacterium]